MAADPYRTAIHIAAAPETVYDHFTQAETILRWMGDYAVLDPRPGGEFTLDINGVPVRGRYLELDPPHRLVISWGHAGSDRFPPGSSRVELTFTRDADGTLLEVLHTGIPEAEADQHALGWRHFLDRLAASAPGGDPGPDPWAVTSPGA